MYLVASVERYPAARRADKGSHRKVRKRSGATDGDGGSRLTGCESPSVWQPGRDFRRLTDRLTGMIIAALGPLRARAKIPTEP
jgi:hypothetical protein